MDENPGLDSSVDVSEHSGASADRVGILDKIQPSLDSFDLRDTLAAAYRRNMGVPEEERIMSQSYFDRTMEETLRENDHFCPQLFHAMSMISPNQFSWRTETSGNVRLGC